jgi:L-lactate dehydrogenase (cytochrome)
MLGRPWAYALGAAGERGVAHVLKLIDAEMHVAMALTGVTSIQQLDHEITFAQSS